MIEGSLLFHVTIDLAHLTIHFFIIKFLRMPSCDFGRIDKSEMKCIISFVLCIAVANLIGCSPPIQ